MEAQHPQDKLLMPPPALPSKKGGGTQKKPTKNQEETEAQSPFSPANLQNKYGLILAPKEDDEKLPNKEEKGQEEIKEKTKEQTTTDQKYVEPYWSTKPIFQFFVDILKSGVILKRQPICDKGYYLIGRSPICDVLLDHPSISRQHAVIQHRINGFCYLYDLGSTHGTWLNKQQIKPKVYVAIKSGDLIKFGQSSRYYILGGGTEEIEDPEGEVFTGNIDQMEEYLSNKRKRTEEEEQKLIEEEKELIKRYKQIMEEDDQSYDSDEDEFFDRTGRIQHKKKREEQKKAASVVETYETLSAKKKIVENQKNTLETEIKDLDAKILCTFENQEDSLDSFMDSLTINLDKEKKAKKQALLNQLNQELDRLNPLIDLVRPALSDYLPKNSRASASTIREFENTWKKRKLETDTIGITPPPSKKAKSETKQISESDVSVENLIPPDPTLPESNSEVIEVSEAAPANSAGESLSDTQKSVAGTKKKKRRKKKPQLDDANYDDWVPPPDQTGDGKTKLNEVFGY